MRRKRFTVRASRSVKASRGAQKMYLMAFRADSGEEFVLCDYGWDNGYTLYAVANSDAEAERIFEGGIDYEYDDPDAYVREFNSREYAEFDDNPEDFVMI